MYINSQEVLIVWPIECEGYFHSLLWPRLQQLGSFCDITKFPTTKSGLFSCVSQWWEEMNLYRQRPVIQDKSVADFPEDFPQVKRIPGLGPEPGRKCALKKILEDWCSMWSPQPVQKWCKDGCKTNFSGLLQWQWTFFFFFFCLNRSNLGRGSKSIRDFLPSPSDCLPGMSPPIFVAWSGVIKSPFPFLCCSLPCGHEILGL